MVFFPSINEAFKNGLGDVCFQNEQGHYSFLSRHNIEAIKEAYKVHKHVPYLEVLELGRAEKFVKPEPKPQVSVPPSAPQKFINHPDSVLEFWMNEMPDGLNNSL